MRSYALNARAFAVASKGVAIAGRRVFSIGIPADVLDGALLERLQGIPIHVGSAPTGHDPVA